MKYLILLLPTFAFANFVKEGGNVTYSKKEVCEKKEGAECFAKPLDAETKSLQLVDVDDLSKPIYEPRELDQEIVRDENGEPVLDEDGNPVTEPRCNYELVKDKCVQLAGYEKKKEKKFVEDAAKVAAKEAKKQKEQAKEQSCDEFKALLADSAIDSKSKAEDVQEVVRRLLGFYKACR